RRASDLVCRTSLTDPGNGCVALNPFKPLTQDMIDYLQYDTSWARQTMRQHVVSAYATGDLFDLPAGAVQAVIGAEYRRESNNIGAIPEYEETNPLFDPTLGSIETGLSGHYDVKEEIGRASCRKEGRSRGAPWRNQHRRPRPPWSPV